MHDTWKPHAISQYVILAMHFHCGRTGRVSSAYLKISELGQKSK